jgi:hypothetical protein
VDGQIAVDQLRELDGLPSHPGHLVAPRDRVGLRLEAALLKPLRAAVRLADTDALLPAATTLLSDEMIRFA